MLSDDLKEILQLSEFCLAEIRDIRDENGEARHDLEFLVEEIIDSTEEILKLL